MRPSRAASPPGPTPSGRRPHCRAGPARSGQAKPWRAASQHRPKAPHPYPRSSPAAAASVRAATSPPGSATGVRECPPHCRPSRVPRPAPQSLPPAPSRRAIRPRPPVQRGAAPAASGPSPHQAASGSLHHPARRAGSACRSRPSACPQGARPSMSGCPHRARPIRRARARGPTDRCQEFPAAARRQGRVSPLRPRAGSRRRARYGPPGPGADRLMRATPSPSSGADRGRLHCPPRRARDRCRSPRSRLQSSGRSRQYPSPAPPCGYRAGQGKPPRPVRPVTARQRGGPRGNPPAGPPAARPHEISPARPAGRRGWSLFPPAMPGEPPPPSGPRSDRSSDRDSASPPRTGARRSLSPARQSWWRRGPYPAWPT